MKTTKYIAAAAIGLAAASESQALIVTSVAGSGNFTNATSLLTNGSFALGSDWNSAQTVNWLGQTGLGGVVLTFGFDKLYRISDLALGVDRSGFYGVQTSINGSLWHTLFVSLPTSIDTSFAASGHTMIEKSSAPGSAAYSSLIDFAPTLARYARIYAVAGEGHYAVSELRFSGTAAPVPEPASGWLLLAGLTTVAFVGSRRRS